MPITHLQHHNKHEYNIDSLLNIQFATVLLQHYITYLQQHTNNTNTMLRKYDYNIDTMTYTTRIQHWVNIEYLVCGYVVATLHPLCSTMHMQCKYDVEKIWIQHKYKI